MNLKAFINLTYEDHVEMAKIESNYFPEELIANPNTTWDTWNKFNNLGVIAVKDMDTNMVVGHLSIMPITDETYNDFLSGSVIDTELTINNLRKYDQPGKYKLYLCSIAIAPQYRNTQTLKLLARKYIEIFDELNTQGIEFTDMIADALTNEGEKFCKLLGMELINCSNHDSKIYISDYSKLIKKLKKIFK